MAQLVDAQVVVIELEGFFVAFQRGVTLDTIALHLDVQPAGDVVPGGLFQVHPFHDQRVLGRTDEFADERAPDRLSREVFRPDGYREGMPDAKSRLCHDGSFWGLMSDEAHRDAGAGRGAFYVCADGDRRSVSVSCQYAPGRRFGQPPMTFCIMASRSAFGIFASWASLIFAKVSMVMPPSLDGPPAVAMLCV